jgi:proteasome accessory factor C
MDRLEITDERMFERLKDGLRRSIGVALEEEDGVYRLAAGGYAMAPLEFTTGERAAIALALAAWRGSEVEAAATAVRTKLTPLGLADEDASLDTALNAPTPGALEIITAITERRPVAFDYLTGYSGELSRREVEPWRLAKRGGAYYLLGFDRGRGDRRVFNLRRVAGPVIPGAREDSFDPPSAAEAHALLQAALDGEARTAAVVKATPHAARVLAAEGGTQQTTDELRLPAAEPFALAAWGGAIDVLDPPELRQAVRDRWEGAAKAHQGEGRAVKPYGRRPRRPAKRHREGGAERAARMVSLVSYLKDHSTVPVAELAKRFGVTQAQVKADLYLLWLDVGRGRGGGDLLDFAWSEDESEVALVESQGLERPLPLTPAEAVTLIAALRSLEGAAGLVEASAAESARAKLEAALGPADQVDVSLPPAPAALGALRDGIGSDKRLAFRYVSQTGAESARRVDPLGLFAVRDHWLLAAWDLGAEAERYFRVDRIADAQVLDEPATPHPYRPHASGWSGTAQLLVDVIFAAPERWRAEELETAAPPLDLPGGSLQVRLAVSNPEWITRMALGGGGAIEVLGPPDVRKRTWLAARAALGA